MRRLAAASMALAAVLAAATAGADTIPPSWRDGNYVSVKVGPTLLMDTWFTPANDNLGGDSVVSHQTGTAVFLAWGVVVGDGRGEVEYSRRADDAETIGGYGVDGVEVSVDSVFLNAYYDKMTQTRLRPYLSAGVGLSWVGVDVLGEEERDLVLSYRVGAGATWQLSPGLLLDLGYSFLFSNPYSLDTSYGEFFGNLLEHSGSAGLRVLF